MKMLKMTLASVAALSLVACAEEAETEDPMAADETAMAEDATATNTVVDVASNDEQFSTLAEAVGAAGLAETLNGEGPFTIFAPTNDAFAKLPEGTLAQLTTEDTEKLGSILQYHVVEGMTDAQTLTQAIEEAGEEGYEIETLNGTLTAMSSDGNITLTDAAGNTATITATDVEASNGTIHVIDTVLMPE